jgi:hypothetical protein
MESQTLNVLAAAQYQETKAITSLPDTNLYSNSHAL